MSEMKYRPTTVPKPQQLKPLGVKEMTSNNEEFQVKGLNYTDKMLEGNRNSLCVMR